MGDVVSIGEIDVSDIGEEDLFDDFLGDEVRVGWVTSSLTVDFGFIAEARRGGSKLV